MYLLIFFIALSIVLYFSEVLEKADKFATKNMRIISPSFEDGKAIPVKYSSDGQSMSPPLQWSEFPKDTKSFVLLCEDIDAYPNPRVHWLLYNIPKNAHKINENVPSSYKLSHGAMHGKNDFGNVGYEAFYTPKGMHHYVFRIYALDIPLDIEAGLDKLQVLKLINNHVLAQGELVGRFPR